MKLGLYLHIPFCRQKCFYCDFPSYSGQERLYNSYTEALRREIAAQGLLFTGYSVDTVYIGGGTPTVLPQPLLLAISREVADSFNLSTDLEWTLEANPGTITEDNLSALHEAGINRISFGIQSFDDHILQILGRIHTAQAGKEAVMAARQAGFTNISIDLMFDLPGQKAVQWMHTLETAAVLDVSHISAYGLKVEEGTPFSNQLQRGTLDLPNEEEQEIMYKLTTRFLPQKGYERYEISNFARPGQASRHNIKYWFSQPYLGLGAAAHSFIQGERLANTADVRLYIDRMRQGVSPVEYRERPDREIAMAEFCFLALRTTKGLSLTAFQERFGISFATCYGQQAEVLAKRGLLALSSDRAVLTELGMKYGNQVFCTFLP